MRLCSKQRLDTWGPLTCPVALIQAAEGLLQDVLCWQEQPARGVGAMPNRVQQAWTALRRRPGRLRASGPEYAGLELNGSRDRLAPLESLCRLGTTLVGKVRATLRAEDRGRLHEWRSWLEEAWTSDQGAVHRWLKNESYAPPVTFLSKPDGTATPIWRRWMASCRMLGAQ